MGRQEEFQRINRLISRWITEIRLNNAVDFYDINRVAEDIAARLLNDIYNYDLVNLNYEQRNYPGIDLGDKQSEIGFQITTRSDTVKIRDCLQKFKKKGTEKYTKGIRFLILEIVKLKFTEKQERVLKNIYPGFDPEKHILTAVDLTRDILQLYDNDPNRFWKVKGLLEMEFADQVKKEKEMSLLERLYKGSKRYYESLTSVRGRFKHLKITDIILPHSAWKSKLEWIDTRVDMDQEGQRQNDEMSENVFSALPKLWGQENKHTVLVGEGGMGKTVSLVRLWEKYIGAESYVPGSPVPVFIQLNEWNRWAETNQRNFITWMIRLYYLEDAVDDKDILQVMKQPVKDKDSFVPSVILLLDGFNEITAKDRTPLLLELRYLMEGFPGVQIVVSSRYDMRGNLNWGQFHLLNLLELSDDQVEVYLKTINFPVPSLVGDGGWDGRDDRRLALIRNPMMLTIYASTCEIEKEHGESRSFDFKERVETPGELLWNFIETQMARLFDRIDKPEGERLFYRFLLKFLLPAVGFEMEKIGRFDITPSELDEIFLKYFHRFCQRDFLSVFWEYRNCLKHLNVKECDDLDVMERIEEILKILVNELCMMVKEGDSFRFLHQNFRDYFAAVHILNEGAVGLEKKEIPEVLKERTSPVYLLRFMGEIEGEHYCKPVLNKGKGWQVKENKESKLFQMLELCRGCFDGSVGYGVWNILESWKVVRGELTSLDLSRLDLTGVGLNGVRCSRFYGDEYIFTVFDESLVNEDNIFPLGHSNDVNSAVYSADGKKILSASDDDTIKEWDVATGQCLKTFEGHKGLVGSAVYSADGKKILSSSWDRTIKEWDVVTGHCLKTFLGHTWYVCSAVYSTDSKKILSGSRDETIKEWDVLTGQCLKTFKGHRGAVTSAFYSPDGEKIFSASEDGSIKEWDVVTAKCSKTFEGHKCHVSSAVYSADGEKILSASHDETIKEWDVSTGYCLRAFEGHRYWVKSAVYSNDGKKILSASGDHTIKEWDVSTGQCLKTFEGHQGKVESAVYSPDGKKILLVLRDDTIKEWDISTGQCLKTFAGYKGRIQSAVYSSNGKKVLSAYCDGIIKEWDVATGQCLKTFEGHKGIVENAVYSADGKKILSASLDGAIKEWEVVTGKCLKTFQGHESIVQRAVYSADGEKILSASWDKTIKEWDVATGQCLKTFHGHTHWVTSAIYDPSGEKILSASADFTIKEWDVATGQCLKTFEWHRGLGQKIVESAVYSADGNKIISACYDGTTKEWDVVTGRCLNTYKWYTGVLNKNRQSKDGNEIITIEFNDIIIKNKTTNKTIRTFVNIPGLLAQGCSFKNLHPQSKMSEKSKQLLKMYGAVVE